MDSFVKGVTVITLCVLHSCREEVRRGGCPAELEQTLRLWLWKRRLDSRGQCGQWRAVERAFGSHDSLLGYYLLVNPGPGQALAVGKEPSLTPGIQTSVPSL